MGDGGEVIRGERFSGGPARSFLSSLDADERLFSADIAVDRAHVIMLAERAIISNSQAKAILEALETIEAEGHGSLPPAEDVHEAIESAVIELSGEAGGAMHTARSRNDEVATCIRYRLRDDLFDVMEGVLDVRAALVTLADSSTTTVMPGYTHQQPAQPTTLAHWACSYVGALARDFDRLDAAVERVNRSPLGTAAFAGTTFPIDRHRTAELLGFDGLIDNAMDAASTRDFILESLAALTGLATTLSGLATDVVLFATLGFVDLDDDFASTSSIMPQKKNPDTLELIRACTGDTFGAYAAVFTVLKGLPRAYHRDLQPATAHAWQATDAMSQATVVAAGAIETADWDETALQRAAETGLTTATDLADLLAAAGIPFRTAHRAVAEAVATADGDAPGSLVEAALENVDGSLEDFDIDEATARIADPLASVEARDSDGGPAPQAVSAFLERAVERIEEDADALAARRTAIELANEKRHIEVQRYG